jgi:hypothetical protein
MEFLKRVVPPILSGDMISDSRDRSQDTFPKLVRMRRFSVLSSERMVDDPDGNNSRGGHYDRYQHLQLGKVNTLYFQFFQRVSGKKQSSCISMNSSEQGSLL